MWNTQTIEVGHEKFTYMNYDRYMWVVNIDRIKIYVCWSHEWISMLVFTKMHLREEKKNS